MIKLSTKLKVQFVSAILISLVAALIYNPHTTRSANSQSCKLAISWFSGEVTSYSCQTGESASQAISKLQQRADIKLVVPIQHYQLSLAPNDPGYVWQKKYLQQINLPQVWSDLPKQTLRPIIAILDSGVDINNQDLKDNIWFNAWEVPNDNIDNDNNGFVDDQHGWDFISNVSDPRPKFEVGWTELAINHGTIVAGVATAVSVVGVDWSARIMPLRVLDAKGIGNTVTVTRAINYAVANGADIINLSFVGPHSDPVLQDAITRAYKAGVLVVAAAGAEAGVGIDMDKIPQYPVCNDGYSGENQIIGVAAVDGNDILASFSNYGSRCVDLAAPGVNIFSTQFSDSAHPEFKSNYGGYWNGTSVAAPMVSGALALLKSFYPRYSPAQLRDILIVAGDSISSANPKLAGKTGRRLNVGAAMELAQQTTFVSTSSIMVAPFANSKAQVQKLDKNGQLMSSFLAYAPQFISGINLAVGDVDGDGQREIVTAPRSGGSPHIRIFDQTGNLKFEFMAFWEGYKGGLSLAVADVNNNKQDDIIVATNKKALGTIRIYNGKGELISQFVPYEDYNSGLNVAAGDVDNDGIMEILVAPQVASRLPIMITTRNGYKKYQIKSPVDIPAGGLNLAVGDLDNDKREEIILSAGKGGKAEVLVLTYQGKLVNRFWAYDKKFSGGVNIAVGDVNNDSRREIITTPQGNGGPQVRIFDSSGKVLSQFFVGDKNFRGGLKVAVFK